MPRCVPVVTVLAIQACLFFSVPSLLPIWTDELHTLSTVAHPPGEIVALVGQDVNPPLYYLLARAWRRLPLPGTEVARLRAMSALWTLIATFLLDLFWTRSWAPFERWLGLSLFALSPCLLLYGRMARSYSMQVALALLSLGLLLRWMAKPRSALLASGSFAAVLTLLYTHYVPGAAILAGWVMIAWRSLGVLRVAGFAAALAAGYLPWVLPLVQALGRWCEASRFVASYSLTGNASLEHVVKIGYGLVSLTIGESFFALSLALAPAMLLLAIRGVRAAKLDRSLLAALGIAGAVGYVGVSRWQSYPFIPARLLWLLPFLSLSVALGISGFRRPAVRHAAAMVILVSFLSSAVLYFRRQNFLNPGYALPSAEIAGILNREAQPRDLIIVDAYNTDAYVLAVYLSGRTPYVILDQSLAGDTRRRMRSAGSVWIVRNTRDISPGRITTEVQSEACTGRPERDYWFEPYPPWQQAAMQIVGIRPPLTHFYQLTQCRQAVVPEAGR